MRQREERRYDSGKRIKKAFDGFVALNGVDMHVEKGAIYGLVGPNGAGKSTLIRHLTGVYRPDQGEVQIDGENVYENKAVKQKSRTYQTNCFISCRQTRWR